MLHTKASRRPEAEADALDAARHAGVVELVEARGGTLRTRLVEGARPVADAGPLTADEVAGLLAAVAAVLADLHGRGVVHGGIDATHVLLRPDGPPVLCSLGRGGDQASDVAALGRLTAGLLAEARPARRRPAGGLLAPPAEPVLAELVAAATADDPAARPSAADLAAAVHQRIPTARLPAPPAGPVRLLGAARRRAAAPEAPGRASLGRDGRRWVLAAGAASLVAAAVVVAGLRGGASPPPPAPPAGPEPAAPAPTPAAAVRVWPAAPAEVHDGVLTVGGRRYAVGRPGDVVAAGDWGCAGTSVALLRPATGEVFAFDGWPGAGTLAGRPVATVAGATGLSTADTDGDGCAELQAERPGAPPVPVRVAR